MELGKKIITWIFLYFIMPMILTVGFYMAYNYWCEFQWNRSANAAAEAALAWSEEDDAAYAKLLWDLYDNFDELDAKERMEVYEKLVEYICVKELGCPVPQVAYDKLEDTVNGQYGNGLICLNYTVFQNPEVPVREKIHTILHETRHSAQHYMVDSFRALKSAEPQLYQALSRSEGFEEILTWEYDIENYDSYLQDFWAYYESNLETDARAFAEKTEEKLREDYELSYSWQDEESVMRSAENTTFCPAYAAEHDWFLFCIIAVVSLGIGFLVLVRSKNRRLAIGAVMAFMAVFCFRSITADSQTFAIEHGFSLYPQLTDSLMRITGACLVMTYGFGVAMKEKCPVLANVQLIAAALFLVVNSYTCIGYMVFCAAWLFLLFYPVKKKKKAVCKRYPVSEKRLSKVS